MTLPIGIPPGPGSPALSLFNLQNEFGGINPIGLNEYYRGGGTVDISTIGGTGSFQTLPMAPSNGPIQIPTSGSIQLSHFYGTQTTIVGNSGGLILSPASNDTLNDYVDVVLPAGVDLIRFFLVGAGGGAGGNNAQLGGNGGGGSTLSGTINTSWAGPVNVARTLRFFIGRGGLAGLSNVPGNSSAWPAVIGGHGNSMFGIQSVGSWSAWLNLYAVTHDMVGGVHLANNARAARSLYFPHSGTYTFQFLADNEVSIALDGVVIASTTSNNDQAYSGGGSFTSPTPLTRTVSISAGHHKLRFTFSNTGSIGSYGVRIVNNTTASEFWTTRYEYAGWTAYPTGGAGGYPGSAGASGMGGGGGSATMFSIINGSGVEYFVALAGGGGGGGGGGNFVPANVSQAANWCNQGWITSTPFPLRVSGGDGEYVGTPNNNSGMPGGVIGNDGGGGGAGGGGVQNARQYVDIVNKNWLYSGFGGRQSRGIYEHHDTAADGGESGKSAVTSYATRYADVFHVPTTTRFPNNPTNPSGLNPTILSGLNSYGIGGTSVGAGVNGAAYVDWGVTNTLVAAPSFTPSAVRASIVPNIQTYLPSAAPALGKGTWITTLSGPKALVLDAFGGGGRPDSEYTYSWTNVVGSVPISTPTSYRTTITLPAINAAGTVRCTVSDGATTASADYNWLVVADDVPPESTCFPAGSMVLMGDGTQKAIETIQPGEMVMSVNGAVRVNKVETPILGSRKLLSFSDGFSWSEEHLLWARPAGTTTEWWWSSNPPLWRTEVTGGQVPGLFDNDSVTTGPGYEYAHVDGWVPRDVIESQGPYDLKLYLPFTNGEPIIVNGYLVTAGTNQENFDYETINWEVMRLQVTAPVEIRVSETVVPPAVSNAPEPFPPGYEAPPIEWTLPIAP